MSWDHSAEGLGYLWRDVDVKGEEMDSTGTGYWASFRHVFFVPSSRYHTLGHGAGPSEHAERRGGQVSVQTDVRLWNAGLSSPDPPKHYRLV